MLWMPLGSMGNLSLVSSILFIFVLDPDLPIRTEIKPCLRCDSQATVVFCGTGCVDKGGLCGDSDFLEVGGTLPASPKFLQVFPRPSSISQKMLNGEDRKKCPRSHGALKLVGKTCMCLRVLWEHRVSAS